MFPVTPPNVRNRGLWPSLRQTSNHSRQFTGRSPQCHLAAERPIEVIWILDSQGFTGDLGLVPVGGSQERAFSRRTPCRFWGNWHGSYRMAVIKCTWADMMRAG